jgi:hypothetical protein
MNDAKYIGLEDLTGFLEGKGNPPRAFARRTLKVSNSDTRMDAVSRSALPRKILLRAESR